MAGGEATYNGTTMANTLKVVGVDLASAGNIDAENEFESKVATDEDLIKIRDAWEEKYEKGRKGDFEAYTLYGKGFHLAIAEATRNSIIFNMMDKLLDATQQPLWVSMRKSYYEEDPSRIEQMLEVHNDIVQAILARNTEKAIQALEADFDNVLKQLYQQNE